MIGNHFERRVLVLCVLGLLWMPPGAAQQTDAQLALGRSIFEDGTGRDGRQLLSSHQNRYGAGIPVVCSDCHGKDAGGGGESFVVAPSIRWSDLSKRYRAVTAGREQVPYDRALFARALRSGVNAGGQKLDPMMPAVDIADDEVDALVAYLIRLSDQPEGVSVQQKAAALLPAAGASVLGDSLRRSISSCGTDGRQSNRYAAFDIIEYESVDEVPMLLKSALASGQALTLIAPLIAGWEAEYQRMIGDKPIATVLPVTHNRPSTGARWYFQFPTSFDLTARLLRSARERGVQELVIHYDGEDPLSSDLLTFSLTTAQQLGIEVVAGAKATDSPLRAAPRLARLWLHGVDPENALRVDRHSLHLVPGVFLRGEVPAAERFTVAHPYPPSNHEQWRPPAEVWADAVCQFLAQVDLRQPLEQQLSTMSLITEEQAELKGLSQAGERMGRAYLSSGRSKPP